MTDPMAKAEITLPLNKVLENAGGELERLAAIAANIDDHIGDLLLHPELASKLSSELMQDVDGLRQAVDCLHRALRNVAGSGETDAVVAISSASEGVYLESVRNALFRA